MAKHGYIESYLKKTDEYRMRLERIMKDNPQSIYYYARDIGISSATLLNFLGDTEKPRFRTICKIENFVIQKEAALKDASAVVNAPRETEL